MQAHDLDAPNLDAVRERRGRSRLFLEDDPPVSSEDDDASTSLEDDEPTPSATRRIFRPTTVFMFVFLILAGVGGALAWRSYGDQMIGSWTRPAATTKSADSPEVSLQELQQQLKAIATDLAAVKQMLEQLSAADHDQITRIQEQIAEQGIALQATKQELEKLSPPPPGDKPVVKPPRKPAQHPAQLSGQESSKPIQVSPPQSLLPPKQ